MKSVGIFICNYNKREFVVNCVKSILEQSFDDFDLFVVDNASTDDSVEKLKECYGDKITIIQNSENLGGSGGFNTGIRRGYNDGYKYIMLVDNDTVLDKDAVFELYKFLEENKDVGMAGAKIFQMQRPEYIQEFGLKLLFDKFELRGPYNNYKDNVNFPKVQESDYLATCCLMVRREVIEKIGPMDEECFIYWDDIDWGHRCRLSGFKCYAVGKAKVWHNFTCASKTNLGFSKYYNQRNSTYFFAKYVLENDIENFAKITLSKFYKFIVGFYCKKQYDMISVIMYALDDFIHNVRGKAPQYKINRTLENREPFHELLDNKNSILINIIDDDFECKEDKLEKFNNCVYELRKINSNLKIFVKDGDWDKEQLELLGKNNVSVANSDADFDLELCFCEHVSNIKKCLLPKICIDVYLNCIYDEETYAIYSNFKINEKLFIETYKNLFIEAVRNIKNNAVGE